MAISVTPLLIGVCGFCYLIVALQLSGGFPPFYEKGNLKEEIRIEIPLLLAGFVALAGSVFMPNLIVLFGLISAYSGVRVRRRVNQRTDGPLPWLLNPPAAGIMNRRPMLIFDAWTIGLPALTGLVILLR